MSYKNTPDAWKMDGLELSVEQKLNDVYDIASTAASGALPSVSSADNGKALLVKSGKWQKAAIPSGAFEVNFTVEHDQQTSAYIATSDKTYSEINAAYTANKNIYAWVHSTNNPTLLTTAYVNVVSTFNFYFDYKSDPGFYARYQIRVGSDSITTFISWEVEPVYIGGEYSDGGALDEVSLEVYNTAIGVNSAPVYINIDVGNSIGIYPFIFNPSDYTGYCFAGPASAIGYTARIDGETGEITVTAPNS